jgi:uracil phosphoribosyltransferase
VSLPVPHLRAAAATGGSAITAIDVLVSHGVRLDHIVFLNLVAAPEGLAQLTARYPAVAIVTAAVDDGLDAHKYILPGLGDFGCRYFGTD